MPERSLDNTINQSNRFPSLRLDRLVSLAVGLLLISLAPYALGFFKDWTVPITSSLQFRLFDVLVIPFAYLGLIYYGLRYSWIKKYERFLFLSIILVILSRIISLLFAETLQLEAVSILSIFRYVEALILIFVFANLFTDLKNRQLFILGIIIAVIIETVGGIFMVFAVNKGYFFSTSSYILQILLILACILTFINKKHRFLMAIFILVLVLAVFATLSRSALIFLMITLIASLIYTRKQILKPILFFIVLVIIASLLTAVIFPSLGDIFVNRVESGLKGQGSVFYRFYLWDKAIATFLEHPLTGIGSGGFARQRESLPQVFQIELDPSSIQTYQTGTHNKVLEVMSDTGIVGLVAYIFWFVAAMGFSLKVLRSSNIRYDTYAIAVSLIVIGLIISDTYSKASFTAMPNVLIGFLLGWHREKTKLSQRIEQVSKPR